MGGHCSPDKRVVGQEKRGQEGGFSKPSEFKESVLTPEQIANNLRDEMKRLKKRREFRGQQGPLSPGSAPSSPEPMMDMLMMEGASSSSSVATPTKQSTEKPIFTLKQMSMIAERMCAERVEQVRAEYDQILQQKLSEQYDAFVKFIDHQIQKRFNESMAPSYLS